ncbi:MAG: AzlD domain-containing protein [bacterium]|nr:AzlD domain-containing protein [bacterium]
MTNREIYSMILGMALVTYLPRALPALFMDRLSIGPQMRRFLGLIPYTARTALVFPAVFAVGESAWQGALGALTAGILAWKKCPVILCVVAAVAVEALLMMV